MDKKEGGVFYNLESLLQQDYRGVNVCEKVKYVYTARATNFGITF